MTSTEPYPVVIIHPSCIFAEALGQLLHQTLFKIERIAAEINSVPLDVLSRTALFLVGGRTPDHVVELVRDIRQRLHSPTIVVIGGAKEPEVVMRALGAGANAYLREDMTSQTLIIALQLVMQEETVLPSVAAKCLLGYRPSQGGVAFEAPHNGRAPEIDSGSSPFMLPNGIALQDQHLSFREAAILQALIDGAPNKLIAQNLNITEATVKVHVKAVLRKIRVKNRTQAAVWAVKNPPKNQ